MKNYLIFISSAVLFVFVSLAGSRAFGAGYTEYDGFGPDISPNIITAGPDGALWFTASGNAGRIGRITTSGSLSEYATLTSGGPLGITAGPDGALWFTERQGRKIGRIATSGSISEFAVPEIQTTPRGIPALKERSGLPYRALMK